MSGKQTRAPRCPEGYMSRSYRTDPAIHEDLVKLAEAEGKKGGAGQILTELAIAHIKKKTGKKHPDGFAEFYKNTNKKG